MHDIECDKDMESKFGKPDFSKSKFNIKTRLWETPMKINPKVQRLDTEESYYLNKNIYGEY